MKIVASVFLLIHIVISNIWSQNVGISPDGTIPHQSAGLDIDFNNKGLLLPRLTTIERNNIYEPALSLMIYNKTTNCFEFYAFGAWHTISCVQKPCADLPPHVSGYPFYELINPYGDGKNYKIVEIGNQCWFAENLNTGTFVAVSEEQNEPGIQKYCYNNSPSNCNIFGGLYQWEQMMNGEESSSANPSGVKGICPTGWHLPSDSEWKQLEVFLGMTQEQADGTNWRGTDEGQKLAGNEQLWTNGALDGNGSGLPPFGESGFDALPGGHSFNQLFFLNNASAFFFTTTQYEDIYAFGRRINSNNTRINRNHSSKNNAFSVRCLKN